MADPITLPTPLSFEPYVRAGNLEPSDTGQSFMTVINLPSFSPLISQAVMNNFNPDTGGGGGDDPNRPTSGFLYPI